MMRFAVADEPLDADALRTELHNPRHGGFCAFEGWVRDTNDGRAVDGLDYEIYPELAQIEGDRILGEAAARFGGIDAIGIHRSGSLKIGEMAVWVGVSSAHRDEAFRACRFIIDEIKHRLPVWKKERYLTGETAWVACAHPAASEAADRHDHHRHRHDHTRDHRDKNAFVPDYSRQTRLREVGEAGQARLRAARVLVIGAGGLGSPVLSYLAGAGVGTLGIVEDDRVEASNLHRQTLYGAADIGHPKSEIAAARIAAMNPTVAIELFEERLNHETARQVFARFDLVLDCSDDMRSRYLSSDAGILTGTPVILASVHQYEGQLQIIDPTDGGPCLRCLWPDEPPPGAGGSCAESGVLGPVPGVLGALQANEALKMLLGLQRMPNDIVLLVDLLDNSTSRLRIDTACGCARHGGCAAVAERRGVSTDDVDLSFETLDAARAAGFQIVDIREDSERRAAPITAPTTDIPSGSIADRVLELPSAPLLLVCASGRRSDYAARRLRALGLRAVHSLAGGAMGLRNR